MKVKLLKKLRRKYWFIYDRENNEWLLLYYKTGERTKYDHIWQFLLKYAEVNMSFKQWLKYFNKTYSRFNRWCDENNVPQATFIGDDRITNAYLNWLSIK